MKEGNKSTLQGNVQQKDTIPESAPVGTLVVVATLMLATIGMWMLILGIQQGRA